MEYNSKNPKKLEQTRTVSPSVSAWLFGGHQEVCSD